MRVNMTTQQQQCPKCKAEGRDRAKDNMVIYDDHGWCFAGHGYIKLGSELTRLQTTCKRLADAEREPDRVLADSPFTAVTSDVDWQHIKEIYGLSYVPAGIQDNCWVKYHLNRDIFHFDILYHHESNALVFPLLLLEYHTSRSTLFGLQYKYLHPAPLSPRFKTLLFSNAERPPLMAAWKSGPDDVIVVVEDMISFLRVREQYNTICLLGSNITMTAVQRLHRSFRHDNTPIRLWLDWDMKEKAMLFSQRARQLMPNWGTIITQEDPKYYTDQEIKEIVSRSL